MKFHVRETKLLAGIALAAALIAAPNGAQAALNKTEKMHVAPMIPAMTTMTFKGVTHRIDPQMKAVLMSLKELHGKPIEKLKPANARVQPLPGDAVLRLLKKQGRSTAPEAVGSVVNTKISAPLRDIPVRVYKPKNAPSGKLPVLVYFSRRRFRHRQHSGV